MRFYTVILGLFMLATMSGCKEVHHGQKVWSHVLWGGSGHQKAKEQPNTCPVCGQPVEDDEIPCEGWKDHKGNNGHHYGQIKHGKAPNSNG